MTVRRIVAELGKDPDLAVRAGEIYSWVCGTTRPRPERAIALARMSGGRISLDDVYGHSTEVRGERADARRSPS